MKTTVPAVGINPDSHERTSDGHLERFRHLGLWGEGLDVGHVAGDGQDVEAVVDGHAVLAGRQ